MIKPQKYDRAASGVGVFARGVADSADNADTVAVKVGAIGVFVDAAGRTEEGVVLAGSVTVACGAGASTTVVREYGAMFRVNVLPPIPLTGSEVVAVDPIPYVYTVPVSAAMYPLRVTETL